MASRTLCKLRLVLCAVVFADVASAQIAVGPKVQAEVVSLGPAVRVTLPRSGAWRDYFWVNADSLDSNYLMVCGMRKQPRDNRASGVVIVSADGGSTWQETLVDSSTEWVSEDACAYGNDGTVYFGAGASNFYNGLIHHESGWFHFYRSKDHGLTWNKPSVRLFVDFPSVAVDQTAGPNRGSIYVFGNAELIRPRIWQKQPSVLTSRNEGISFGRPVGPTNGYGSGMPSQSLVLNDGTAIAAVTTVAHTSGNTADSTVQMFATSDSGKTPKSRAVIGDFPSGPDFVYVSHPSLAQDNGHGQYHGRLYVAWTVMESGTTTMYLGWSDDRGYHWKTRSLFKGHFGETLGLACDEAELHEGSIPTIDQTPGLAVANGVLGLTWAENGGESIHFAPSRDGGLTFGKDTLISTCTPVEETQYLSYLLWGLPYKESWGAHIRLRSMGKSYGADYGYEDKLGFSIRIEHPFTFFWSTYLICDAAGAFHVLWTQPGPGGLAIWTRTIAIGDDVPTQLASDAHTDLLTDARRVEREIVTEHTDLIPPPSRWMQA